MKKTIAIILCAMLAGSSALSLSGCSKASISDYPDIIDVSKIEDSDIQSGAETYETPTEELIYDEDSDGLNQGLYIFSAELFRRAYENRNEGDNVFLSPLSVYTAFSMLDNGAAGETDQEIRNVLGGGFGLDNPAACFPDFRPPSTNALNSFFKNYMNTLGGDETKFTMANSVWLMKRDDIHPNESFISSAEEFYNAEIFNEAANSSTVDKINGWVSKNTDKMIEQILSPDDITSDTVSILLNAVAFDGKWEETYEESDVWEEVFTNFDGSESKVEFMHSKEERYINDGNAQGFIKYYQSDSDSENKYCFIAILPNEDIGIDKYVESCLTDELFKNCYDNAIDITVRTSMPKFKFDTSYSLSSDLYDMGMKSAFDINKADFSNMATSDNGNISIGQVLHKAHIEVDEKGTKAAAVTGIIAETNAMSPASSCRVILDRPFLFAIYDYENEIPMFIGAMMNK